MIRIPTLTLLTSALAVSLGTAASGQSVISYGPVTTISTAAADIVTDLNLVYAIDAGGSGDGVTFTGQNGIDVAFQSVDAAGANEISGFFSKFGNQAGFGGGDSDYGAVVDDGLFRGGDALAVAGEDFTENTIVLSDLVVGEDYIFQYWAQDAGRNDTFLTTLDGTINLALDANNDADNFGQFVVGSFTATETTQSIGLDGSLNGAQNDGRTQLNAFQLRSSVIPEPASLALLGLGSLAMLGRRKKA